MHPPFGLHSPHSDNTPEGKATGQPASGWPVPQVFLQPLSGTREPGGETVGGWGWTCLLSGGAGLHTPGSPSSARPKYPSMVAS